MHAGDCTWSCGFWLIPLLPVGNIPLQDPSTARLLLQLAALSFSFFLLMGPITLTQLHRLLPLLLQHLVCMAGSSLGPVSLASMKLLMTHGVSHLLTERPWCGCCCAMTSWMWGHSLGRPGGMRGQHQVVVVHRGWGKVLLRPMWLGQGSPSGSAGEYQGGGGMLGNSSMLKRW